MKALLTLKSLLFSKKGKQFAGLFSANVIGIPVSFISNIVITSYLGASLFGDYQFIYTIFNTANILLNFGTFYAGNRALVFCKNRDEAREYYGAMLFVILVISLLMAIGVSIYSLVDQNVIEKGMDKYLMILLPFSGVFMLNQCFETMLQADNQIKFLGYSRLLPKLVLLTGAVGAYFFARDNVSDKLMLILAIYVFALLSVYIYIFLMLKPKFNNVRVRLKSLLLFEKSYGFDVYLGAVCAVGFAQLSDILISYFSNDNTGLGFYRLAVQFCTPLSFIPMTLANTNFKDFSISDRINPKLVRFTVLLSGFVMLMLWVVVPFVLKWFFKPEFQPVFLICVITSIGIILYGLADFFNRFLAAKGMGKLLRNVSFVLGPCVLSFGVLLIPRYGAYGAAVAKILSGLTYFGIMYYSYRKTISN